MISDRFSSRPPPTAPSMLAPRAAAGDSAERNSEANNKPANEDRNGEDDGGEGADQGRRARNAGGPQLAAALESPNVEKKRGNTRDVR